MKKVRLSIMFILLSIILLFLCYAIYSNVKPGSKETINVMSDTSSTKEWQDTAISYISKRNNIINGIAAGKYKSIKACENEFQEIEHTPLLDGDISLAEYLYNNPGQYKDKIDSINIEYSDIRKLTREEVMIIAKMVYKKNDCFIRSDYEIAFTNVNGKWLLSRLAFAN